MASNIVSADGGGLRGIISLVVLERLHLVAPIGPLVEVRSAAESRFADHSDV